jgi:thiol-disulfide isomerase/thioredoxin
MKRNCQRGRRIILAATGMLLFGLVARATQGDAPIAVARPAPALAGIAKWINSKPLSVAEQRGKVVVLHFWTFGCINCRHNLPFCNRWADEFAKENVQFVGIHTPETDGEGDVAAVAARVAELGIKYPIAVDNDRATWDAFGNRYWPGIYLIDKKGRIRYRWDGELEYQGAGGDAQMRAKIRELLAE